MTPRSRLAACLLLGLTLAGCAADMSTQHDRSNVIAVTGVGRVVVRPDTAFVNLGVEARAPVLADATADVSRRMAEVLARIKALGVGDRDMTTIQYAVDPIVAPRQKEQDPTRILAYRVANVVRVRIRDVTAAGPVVDAAVGAGANVVSSLQFTVDDRSPAESEARTLAVKSAEAKAREIAAAGGVTLGGLLSVTEGPIPQPLPGPRAMMAVGAGPGPVEAGQFEIVVTVEARYRIAPR